MSGENGDKDQSNPNRLDHGNKCFKLALYFDTEATQKRDIRKVLLL